MFEMEFKFSKISSMRSKAFMYVYVSLNEIAWLAAQTTPYTLCHRLSKQAFVEGNGKTSVQKKSVKSLRYTDEFLLSTSDQYLKVVSYIIARYKASNFSQIRLDL